MKTLRSLFVTCVLAGLLAPGVTAVAQDLKIQVDRSSGDLTLTGVSAAVVDLAGYTIVSTESTLGNGTFTGLNAIDANWDIAVNSATQISETLGPGTPFTSINDTISHVLGTGVYNPLTALTAAGFGNEIEEGDLSVQYADPILNEVRTGVIEYLGEREFNNIGITVDLSDGTAIIENESPFNQTITGYLIEATTVDTLNTNGGTFTGVGGSFESPNPLDGQNIGEIDPTGTGLALNAGASINLGVIGGSFEDLSMSFILAGIGEVSRDGFIKYLNAPTSDTEPDGDVDGADFLELQRTNPAGIAQWIADYPSPLGAVSGVVSVPEPTTGLLCLLGCISVAGLGRRNR